MYDGLEDTENTDYYYRLFIYEYDGKSEYDDMTYNAYGEEALKESMLDLMEDDYEPNSEKWHKMVNEYDIWDLAQVLDYQVQRSLVPFEDYE